MAIVSYSLDEMPPMSEEQVARLKALAERPDSEIDYSDIPELTKERATRMTPFSQALDEWRQERQNEEIKTKTALNIAERLLGTTDLTVDQIAEATDLDPQQIEALVPAH